MNRHHNGTGGPGPGPDPAMYRAIVESSVSPFVVVDATGTVTWAGPQVETLLGEPAERFTGRHFLEVIAEQSHDAAIAAFTSFVATGETRPWIGPPMLLDLVRADGTQITCEVSAAMGAPHGIDGAILHIRRWRGTVLLHEAIDALAGGASLAEMLDRLIALLEHDAPGSATSMAVGWDGARWATVVHGPTVLAAPDRLRATAFDDPAGAAVALERPGVSGLADLPPAMVAATEEAGFADCWVFPVGAGEGGSATAAVVVWRTVAGPPQPHLTTTPDRVVRLVRLAIESAATRAAWQRAARTDELTGIANRAALHDHVARLDASGDARTILFCDLDGFKAVNDRYGHGPGDQALTVIAARLVGAIRPGDLAVRWGGDEFAIVCAGRVDARALAERIIERVNEPVVIDGHRIELGISIGVASSDEPCPIEDLLERGDEVLRAAKARGKNQLLIAR